MPYVMPATVTSFLVDNHLSTQADIDEKGSDVLFDLEAGTRMVVFGMIYAAAQQTQLRATVDALNASNSQMTMNNTAATNWATRSQIATSVWPADPTAQADLAALLDADSDAPPPLPIAPPALQDSSVASSTTLSQQKATDIQSALAAAIAAAVPPPPANNPEVMKILAAFEKQVTDGRTALVDSGVNGPAMANLDAAFETFKNTRATLGSSGQLNASGQKLKDAVSQFYKDILSVASGSGIGDENLNQEVNVFLMPYVKVRDSLPALAAKEAAAEPPLLKTPWPTAPKLQQALTAWLSRQNVPATVWTPGQPLTENTQNAMQDFFDGQKTQLGTINDQWANQVQTQNLQMQQATADFGTCMNWCTAMAERCERMRTGVIANF